MKTYSHHQMELRSVYLLVWVEYAEGSFVAALLRMTTRVAGDEKRRGTP
jgi:hypothetical protein